MCLLRAYSLFTAIEIIDAYKVSREGFQCVYYGLKTVKKVLDLMVAALLIPFLHLLRQYPPLLIGES